MQKFKYKAVDINKKKYHGVFLAENEKDLKQKLSDMGLYVLSCTEQKNSSPNAFFTLSGKISTKDLSAFCREFSMLLQSSMEVINCLQLLKVQQKNSYFRKILEIVYFDVQSGVSLTDAFLKHKKAFPQFFISMVYVGEMSSNLETVLLSMAEYLEKDLNLKSKVKSALAYPVVMLVLLLGVVILMMAFVIPTFRNSLSRLDIELPDLTRVIYSISDFFVVNWAYILLSIIGVVVLFRLLIATKKGRIVWDKIKISMPIFGKVSKSISTARLARGLGLLLKSGMKLVEAMEVGKKLVGNKYIEKKFDTAIEQVKSGSTLFDALCNMNIFSDVFLQMVAVSEKTATLDEGMNRAAAYFDNQSQNFLQTATSLIQPILILFIGIVVAVMFMAVYSPIVAMMGTVM